MVNFEVKDIEKGSRAAEHTKAAEESGGLDEYVALQRYISTYRDPKAASDDDEAYLNPKKRKSAGKKKWSLPWRKGPTEASSSSAPVPTEWLETDIKNGISTHEVEQRRRLYGFNEITTEKENMLLKFLSYFQGPILYGTLPYNIDCTPYR